MGSYFLFMNDRRKTLAKDHPKVTGMGDQTKFMTAEWKALTETQKAKWEKLAATDKQRYEDQKEAAGESTGKGSKGGGKGKEDGGPKKPFSAYMLFGKDFREKSVKKDTKATDVMRLIGEAWKKISAKDKKKYDDLAEKDKVRY